jgi:hypothetical protein
VLELRLWALSLPCPAPWDVTGSAGLGWAGPSTNGSQSARSVQGDGLGLRLDERR